MSPLSQRRWKQTWLISYTPLQICKWTRQHPNNHLLLFFTGSPLSRQPPPPTHTHTLTDVPQLLSGSFFCSLCAISCISHQKKNPLVQMWFRLGDISQSLRRGRHYLCCGSCLRLGPASIQGNRSTSLWSCTAHTPGCTLGDGYSSPPPRRSCCWRRGEAPGDKNTQLLFLVLRYTGGCSHLWPRDTDLWREAKKISRVSANTKAQKVAKQVITWRNCASNEELSFHGCYGKVVIKGYLR